MSKIFTLILVISALIFTQCANQRPPTGGKKDEKAPELVSSTPANEQLNFSELEITLEFNEAIKLNNAKEELIITPRIQGEYEIKYKKDNVIIKLEDPLKDNTTYTLNFREGVQDLNEGNPAENLSIAFSTGSYLDSLQISGSVRSLMKNKNLKDMTVSLYELGDTLNPLEHPPIYFTKTNDKGKFVLNNLKSSTYKIIALQDKNKNLFIDSKSENYGFIIDTLNLIQNIDSLQIDVQLLDVRPMEFQGGRQIGTTFSLKYNKSIIDYSITTTDTTVNLVSNFANQLDKETVPQHTIQFFNTNVIQDSLLTYIKTYDSLNIEKLDTIYLKFEETKRDPKNLNSKLTLETIIPENGQMMGTLDFSKPIRNINFDSAYIFIDSLNILPLDSSNLTFNKYDDFATFNFQLDKSLFEKKPTNEKDSISKKDKQTVETKDKKENREISKGQTNKMDPYLNFGPNTFISVESDSSKKMQSKLVFKKTESFAILYVEIDNNSNKKFEVQLINSKNAVVQSKTNNKITFKHIPPGDYKLRVLVDENNNGRWDPGNINKNIAPEPVYFILNSDGKDIISLRANFEVGPYSLSI